MSNTYNPNGLLDTAMQRFSLKNDAALSRFLETSPPAISKMRHGRLHVGATTIVRLIEAGMTLPEIRTFVPR